MNRWMSETIYIYIYSFTHPSIHSFFHPFILAFFLQTALRHVHSLFQSEFSKECDLDRASSLNVQYSVVSLRSSSSRLRLLHRISITSIVPSIFLKINVFQMAVPTPPRCDRTSQSFFYFMQDILFLLDSVQHFLISHTISKHSNRFDHFVKILIYLVISSYIPVFRVQ